MKGKTRLTLFSRIFFFSIFFAPLAYVIANFVISHLPKEEVKEVIQTKYEFDYPFLIDNPKQAGIHHGVAEELKIDLADLEENLLEKYVGTINIQQQTEQSRTFHNEVIINNFDLFKGEDLQRVQTIAKRLIAILDANTILHPDFEFHIISSKEGTMANAFCSGSKVYVTRKMMRLCSTPDLLAAVLSHELAHGYLNHCSSYFSRKNAANKLFGDNSFGNIAGNIYANILDSPLGWGDEACADLSGLKVMAEAGYDPTAMADLFYLLSKEREDTDESYIERLLINSHPLHSQRISAITNAIYFAEKKIEEKS